MSLRLEIETRDNELANSLFLTGASVDLGNGVTVRYDFSHLRKGGDFPHWAELIVGFGTGVSSGVVANLLTNWLLKLKGRVERVTIENTEIQFDSSEKIEKIIIETITKDSRPS